MKKTKCSALLCLAAIQVSSAISANASDSSVRLDIAPAPLDAALITWGKQTGNQVLISDSVRSSGQMVSALEGRFVPEDALKTLLANTSMTYIFTSSHTVAIIPADAIELLQSGQSDFELSTEPSNPTYGTSAKQTSAVDSLEARVGAPDWHNAESPSSLGNTQRLKSDSRVDTTGAGLGAPEEIIVSAQKREERLQDVPIAISVLSGDTLDRATFSGVTEALSAVSGVTANPTLLGGGTQLAVRGVGAGSALFTGSSPVAYYLDSVPFGFVKSAFGPDPGTYDLQRIEVLRGPQGTLYGASAENGLVHVFTNDANLNHADVKARTYVSATEGGAANYGADAAVNLPVIEGKLAVRGVIDYSNLSGWINNPVADHVNDSQLRNYRVKINSRPTDVLSIGLSAWITRDNYGAPPASTADRRITAELPEPISTSFDAYSVKIGYEAPSFSLSSSTSYFDYKNAGTVDLGIYKIGLPSGLFPVYTNIYSWVRSEEINLNSKSDSDWRWTAGLFYRNATDRLFQDLPGLVPVPLGYENQSKSYALFGEVGKRFLARKLEWTLGARYFHDDVSVGETTLFVPDMPLIHQSASFHPTTPRAVLTWYPTPVLTGYASFSEGFRSGFPQDPGVVAAAPTIGPARPDKLYNYEVGAKGDVFDKFLSFDAAVYYMDWKDVQQSISVPYGDGLTQAALLNGESASGIGVDLGVSTQPVGGLHLGANLSWNDLSMDSEVYSGGALLFRKGDRLNYSSKFTGSASMDYDIHTAYSGFSTRISLSTSYTSKQTGRFLQGTSGVVNTGNSILIARSALVVISPEYWSVKLYVDNLFNNYGAIPSGGAPIDELNVRPRPRTYGIQLDYKP